MTETDRARALFARVARLQAQYGPGGTGDRTLNERGVRLLRRVAFCAYLDLRLADRTRAGLAPLPDGGLDQRWPR